MDTLSIFVDESGSFRFPDRESRFYILCMVFHDQSKDISADIARLEQADSELGLVGHCFHAGPLIRREKGYSMLSRQLRGKLLSRMMAFARNVAFQYHCLAVDKSFIDSADQISARLASQLADFIVAHNDELSKAQRIKIYYDCGQPPVTKLLHRVFSDNTGATVEFAPDVKPGRYRLFQLADLICTLHLIELKLRVGIQMTKSELQFFGGQRKFRHNILRYIKAKELP